jgi:predicted nucleic acid-binding protein
LLNADELLIDDRAGRAEAARLRLRVTGTLGVLADAHLAGLVDFDEAITRLHSTNFRLDPDLERIVRLRISTERMEP